MPPAHIGTCHCQLSWLFFAATFDLGCALPSSSTIVPPPAAPTLAASGFRIRFQLLPLYCINSRRHTYVVAIITIIIALQTLCGEAIESYAPTLSGSPRAASTPHIHSPLSSDFWIEAIPKGDKSRSLLIFTSKDCSPLSHPDSKPLT